MLPSSITDAEPIYRGRKIDLYRVTLPGGHQRELVTHGGAVVVLPLLDDGRVVLIRNQRFAVDQELWELPAGTLETGEDPAECAQRELIEETGYRAGHVEPMNRFYATPGFCTEQMWTYLATGLTHVGQDLDEGERIRVEPLPTTRALEMIRTGEVRDAKTIAALLYHQQFLA